MVLDVGGTRETPLWDRQRTLKEKKKTLGDSVWL